ncbi:hypothetical protein DTL42_19475 [Bremerella cremea]|uniref:Uncharacterized protein n=1 Tax=Bremerella cremea TaxID=1031537 RepID=A0A368KM80_9BACT|nr:hypothetical protein [Bremerella cremea]RCS42321.1 hypothetical protein DTL42_19475 [Bremerella cremea]
MDSVKWYAWKPGKNVLRIIPGFDPRHCQAEFDAYAPPPVDARECFYIEARRSKNVGPNKRVVFLDSTRPGPIEKLIQELQGCGDKAAELAIRKLQPANRAFFFVIDRHEEQVGPQCIDWNMLEYIKLFGLFVSPDNGDISCPFQGYDLIVEYIPKEASNNGFAQWPNMTAAANSTPITKDEDKWLDWLGEDLFETTKAGWPHSVEYIQACLDGTGGAFEGVLHLPPPPSEDSMHSRTVYRSPMPFPAPRNWPGSC